MRDHELRALLEAQQEAQQEAREQKAMKQLLYNAEYVRKVQNMASDPLIAEGAIEAYLAASKYVFPEPQPLAAYRDLRIPISLKERNKMNVEATISVLANSRARAALYTEFDLEMPSELSAEISRLETELKRARQDSIEAELKSIDARLEALKSADDKRADLNAKREKLLAKFKPTA